MSKLNISRPIRVLQLGSPTGLYGAERWILALTRHLSATEVESIVAVIRDEPALEAPLCRQAAQLGLRTQIFEAHGRVNWSAVGLLRRFLVENDVHILHTHGYKTDLIGLLATRRTHCRLISTPHGWSVQAGPLLRLYELLDRAAFPLFDAVAPLSESLFTELQRWPWMAGKMSLIPNGVDISEIDAATNVAEEVSHWRERGNFIVGYVGQLIPRKGLTVLLDAFAMLAVPKKKLVIVGEGPQRSLLEAHAAQLGLQSDVIFCGFRADRLAYLRGFDAFVLASRLEGIPRCLMEAMAANVPIIATNIPGCTDLIKHGETGLLFAPDAAAAAAQCLQQCLDPALRSALAHRARQFVVANYSAMAMARRYVELYETVLRRGASRREHHD